MGGSFVEGLSLNRAGGSLLYSKNTTEWANNMIQSYERRRLKRNSTGRTGVCLAKRILKSGKIVYFYRSYLAVNGVQHQSKPSYTLQEAISKRKQLEIDFFGKEKSDLLEDECA